VPVAPTPQKPDTRPKPLKPRHSAVAAPVRALSSSRKPKSLQYQQSTVDNEVGLTDPEWAAVKPLLSTALLADPNAAIEAVHRIVERLNEQSEHEPLWHGEVMPGEGLVFSRTRQGINERYLIDAATLLRL
jgi:hypothetical protein